MSNSNSEALGDSKWYSFENPTEDRLDEEVVLKKLTEIEEKLKSFRVDWRKMTNDLFHDRSKIYRPLH